MQCLCGDNDFWFKFLGLIHRCHQKSFNGNQSMHLFQCGTFSIFFMLMINRFRIKNKYIFHRSDNCKLRHKLVSKLNTWHESHIASMIIDHTNTRSTIRNDFYRNNFQSQSIDECLEKMYSVFYIFSIIIFWWEFIFYLNESEWLTPKY